MTRMLSAGIYFRSCYVINFMASFRDTGVLIICKCIHSHQCIPIILLLLLYRDKTVISVAVQNVMHFVLSQYILIEPINIKQLSYYESEITMQLVILS